MIYSIKKILYIFFVACILSSCSANDDYIYLLRNPKVLEKSVEDCRNQNVTSEHCALVQKAAQDFVDLVNQRKQDPADFGMQIMQAQNELVALQNSAKSDKSPGLQEKLRKQEIKLQSMLAVVAATSVE